MGDALPLLSLGTGKLAVSPSPAAAETIPPTPAPTVAPTPAPTAPPTTVPVRSERNLVLEACAGTVQHGLVLCRCVLPFAGSLLSACRLIAYAVLEEFSGNCIQVLLVQKSCTVSCNDGTYTCASLASGALSVFFRVSRCCHGSHVSPLAILFMYKSILHKLCLT